MFYICNDILYSMIEASVTCIDTYYARARRHTCTRTCAYISAHPQAHTHLIGTHHKRTHEHTCARTPAHAHMRTHRCTHTCIHVGPTHPRIHTTTYARTYAHIPTRATMQIYAYACRRANIYTHTVTNMLACTYIYTQTRAGAHLGL